MKSRFSTKFLHYFLLLPSIVVVLVFLIIPSIQSLYLAFFMTTPFGDRLIYVGLENFQRIFQSADYIRSFMITVFYTGAVVILAMGTALGMAVLASNNIRGIKIYRTLLIWPYALSHAVAGVIWGILLHPNVGLVSYWIERLTSYKLNWIADGTAAMIVIILAASWKMLGYNIIFFLAGLQNVSRELTEAAQIDGATGFTCFWRVTFPLISPITFFLLIMNSLQTFFESFGLIDVLTHGGPARSTEILVYKLYRDGFLSFRTGFASAQSIILFVVVAIFTIMQFRVAGKKVFYQ